MNDVILGLNLITGSFFTRAAVANPSHRFIILGLNIVFVDYTRYVILETPRPYSCAWNVDYTRYVILETPRPYSFAWTPRITLALQRGIHAPRVTRGILNKPCRIMTTVGHIISLKNVRDLRICILMHHCAHQKRRLESLPLFVSLKSLAPPEPTPFSCCVSCLEQTS